MYKETRDTELSYVIFSMADSKVIGSCDRKSIFELQTKLFIFKLQPN